MRGHWQNATRKLNHHWQSGVKPTPPTPPTFYQFDGAMYKNPPIKITTYGSPDLFYPRRYYSGLPLCLKTTTIKVTFPGQSIQTAAADPPVLPDDYNPEGNSFYQLDNAQKVWVSAIALEVQNNATAIAYKNGVQVAEITDRAELTTLSHLASYTVLLDTTPFFNITPEDGGGRGGRSGHFDEGYVTYNTGAEDNYQSAERAIFDKYEADVIVIPWAVFGAINRDTREYYTVNYKVTFTYGVRI